MKLELSAKIQLSMSINDQSTIGEQAMLCLEKAWLMRLRTSKEYTMVMIQEMGILEIGNHLPIIATEKV